MRQRATRTRPCGPSQAADRLRHADKFAELAAIGADSDDGAARSAAVSNAVLAGIAVADALCCTRLGERSSSSTHSDALPLVRKLPRIGREAEKALQTLLGLKSKAQYEDADPSTDETLRAMRAMKKLIALARTA